MQRRGGQREQVFRGGELIVRGDQRVVSQEVVFAILSFMARAQRLHGVAVVQVAFASKGLRPGVRVIGSRVDRKQARFKLWASWIQLLGIQQGYGPRLGCTARAQLAPHRRAQVRAVAVQVEFGKQTLETIFSLQSIGSRVVGTLRCFQLTSTCAALPRVAQAPAEVSAVPAAGGRG
jgi:hypothetical protein